MITFTKIILYLYLSIKRGGNSVNTAKNKMKNFIIAKTEKNISWVKENLMEADYKILAAYIAIYYRHDFQKTDILTAIA